MYIRVTGGAVPTAGMTTVEWDDLVTQDMSLLADTVRHLYANPRSRFTCPDPARAEGRIHQGSSGGLSAALLHTVGFTFSTEIPLRDLPMATVCRTGFSVFRTGREERRVSDGQAFLTPAGVTYTATGGAGDYLVLGVPEATVGSLAEEKFGLPAADLRFEPMASPLSAAAQDKFTQTAEFLCAELVTSEVTELYTLQVAALRQHAAAAFLDTFPSNAMTAAYQPSPGWVAPAPVRRAAEFIEAHADQPLTADQIAAAAGVTSTALRDAFRRRFGTSPTGYLRQARLERAHQELEDADPASTVTVISLARRWGWLSVSRFIASYQRQFGALPNRGGTPEG
jgi:AraC-like DNA-binding protein